MTPPNTPEKREDVEGLIARLDDIWANDDHARGCEGRTYTCSCGFDDRSLQTAQDASRTLSSPLEELRQAHEGWEEPTEGLPGKLMAIYHECADGRPINGGDLEHIEEAAHRLQAAELRALKAEGELLKLWPALQQFAHDTGAAAGDNVVDWFASHTDTLRARWKVQDGLFAQLQAAELRASKAEEREKVLMGAVKPFARLGDLIDRLGPKADGSAFNVSEYGEHCRRAAAALSLSEDADQPLLKDEGEGWRPIESAPDDFDETYFLVRPRGLHPARQTPFVPSVVTRLGSELFSASDHIDPIKWNKAGDITQGPTTDILDADLEWTPLPDSQTKAEGEGA